MRPKNCKTGRKLTEHTATELRIGARLSVMLQTETVIDTPMREIGSLLRKGWVFAAAYREIVSG